MEQGERAQQAIREVILAHYDLGEVGMPRYLPRAHQRRHRKMLVDTRQGRFLVKTYSTDPHVLDNLRFQHHLADHLARHDLPVAGIQRARNGKRIVELDTWALELQRFVEGHSMRVTPATLAVSAEALGRFHEACRDFPAPERDASIWRFSEVPRDSFARLYEIARQQDPAQSVDECCNRLALFLREANDALNYENRAEFETGLIHGDWHGGNLIFQQSELAAIVDLEFAGRGCYLEDLSYGLSNLCVRSSADTKKLAMRSDVLLDAYQKHRRLAISEMRALYYAVGVKHITTVAYQLRGPEDRVAHMGPIDWMQRLDAQCAWLGQQAEDVRWGRR